MKTKKQLFLLIIASIMIATGGCNKKTEELDDSSDIEQAGSKATQDETTFFFDPENTEKVTDLVGVLSYYPEYDSWGIASHIEGTIDSVDLYLIVNPSEDYPQESRTRVEFSGDRVPSGITSPLAGVTIYYFKISSLKYKSLDFENAETVTDRLGVLSYYPEYNSWGISSYIEGTIDSVDLYLIVNPSEDYPKESLTQVEFSGDRVPSGIAHPIAGVTVYYFKISSLTYK
ncbi:MAG: hypothetical protein LBQ78_06075 [Tannerellaceae bacterium]|nr:hypothetical protein [Tannerellaceae bacterium]